jgi:hypothetical protein
MTLSSNSCIIRHLTVLELKAIIFHHQGEEKDQNRKA